MGEICRFFENLFFYIFEAPGIIFTHETRGLRQYSRPMDDLWMQRGSGGDLVDPGDITNSESYNLFPVPVTK